MNARIRSLAILTALLPLAGCDQSTPPAANTVPTAVPVTAETENQLAEARDALQRQALEIDTKTALMEKQLADMEKALKDRENAELRDSLTALKRQNDELRVQAETARRQSNVITQRIVTTRPQVNVRTPQAAPPRDYSLFYERLAPYGRWMDVNGYGYCWMPTLNSANWRPYVDGCWVWSSMGWTWQSNEPFGWAVYHYGRWVNLSRYGWIWVPGSDWAPAWVAWRQSRDYVGWAPLPPERGTYSGVYRDCDSQYNLGPSSYTFITTNHFVRPSYTHVCAPVVQNVTIFQSSVNTTQIVRREDHDHRHSGSNGVFVHHGGPPRAQMEQVCERPVPQVQVNAVQASQMPVAHTGHRQHEAVQAPVIVELPAVRPDARPIRPEIADRIEKPKPMSGFEGVPQRAAEQIRETIAEDKATAVVQQPVIVTAPVVTPSQSEEDHPKRHRAPAEAVPTLEIVRPAVAVMDKAPAETVVAPAVMPPAPALETVAAPAVIEPKPVAAPEPAPALVRPAISATPAEATVVEAPALPPTTPVAIPLPEAMKPEVPAIVTAPVPEPEKAMPAVATPAPAEAVPSQTVTAEKMAAEQAAAAAEAEKIRLIATEQQAQAAAMQQRQQQEAQERLQAEKMAAEAEKTAMDAAAKQQESMAAEKARQQAEATAMQEQLAAQRAAEAEKIRQQTEAAAMQEQLAAQRAAEAEKARQQAEAAAMQRQQEEAARKTAEEQQMRQAQQEAARRAAEEQMRAQQEAAQRAAQEMAQRQAEEAARRAQEEAQRAAAEAAARAAAEAAARNQPQPQNPGM